MRALVLAALLAGVASTAQADTRGARWMREHGSFEWMVASGGWRTALGGNDQLPGFDALGGGTELLLGVDVYGPLALVLTGRFFGGVQRGGEFLEGLGGAGLQLRLSESVRLRAGAAAGQASNRAAPSTACCDDQAVLVGGWLACSVDLFALGGGRLSMALSLRLDIDGLLGGARLGIQKKLPDQSLALALGIGLRY